MYKLFLLATLIVVAYATPMLHHQSKTMRPLRDGRIVGGEDAEIEDHPYQLSLQLYTNHYCGASLISEKFAVTAAHCIHGSSPSFLTIRAGSAIRESGGQVVLVAALYTHPQYDSYHIDYDIGVLELATPLTLGSGVQPANLPSLNQIVPVGSDAVCTGWGTLTGGRLAKHLQAVTVQIVSNEVCNISYGTITDRMICAGVPGGGKDACQGDSGGPLIVDDELVGIVSWGRGCALRGFPGVYSSVPNLRNFITEHTGI